jgi:minor extracellular serine protease Vpr
MAFRAWRFALAGAAAIAALGMAVQVSAAGPIKRVDKSVLASASKLPPGLDATPVTVVVLLAGEPVATAQEAAGRKLTRGEKDSVKGQRKNEQDAIRPQIEAAGGKILGTFQSAVNGIKVRIASNRIGALSAIPGVVGVKGVNRYERENALGVPRVGAPAVWSGIPGYHGEGIKVAIIDTGIDFTHANFGGPGTPAAYNAAKAANTVAADPSLFGPLAPRIKGGIDLVGDDYDADNTAPTYQPIPHPDVNPLDCDEDVGHGSHVAGTTGGNGVLSTGLTYGGPYDATTYGNSFRIGPGVAPKADLYAVRVFGCVGSTDVVVEALDWAVDNDMDVVNMSLGSSYGTSDSADALASDNAAKAGVVVVASAGNANDLRYITGSPASSSRTISVAATTTPATIGFGDFALPAITSPVADIARTISAINANGASYASPINGTVKVVRNGALPTSPVSLGCSVAAFQANGGVVGKIAVVNRGTCARVAKAIFGQQAGAIAVVMINNSSGLPPYEGQIFQNPDDGVYYDVTIPFFGARGTTASSTSDGTRLVQRDGLAISITTGTPQTSGIASFSSGGPRNGDSILKPEISAPGSPIISTFVGSGNLQESLSGTSMAAPHVSGIAALVQQAHPGWKSSEVKAAIVNSGDPGAIAGYATHTAGSGFVNAASAAHTKVTASADDKLTSLSFGLEEFKKDYTKSKNVKLRNDGDADATFDVAALLPQGSPHTVGLDKTQVTVKAHKDADVRVTLNIPAATAGNSDAFRDVAGLITFTPVSGANGGIGMRVPYYVVPRVSSNVEAKLAAPVKASSPSGIVNVSNKDSAIAATADFYSWGLQGKGKGSGKKNPIINLASAGAQAYTDGADRVIVFAINTEEAWSAPSTREFDVAIDLDGDGNPEYYVVAVDLGLLLAGAFNGQIITAYFDASFNLIDADFFAYAPYDSSTILLPVLASSIGVTPGNPRFSYTAVGYDLVQTGASDAFAKWAKYNAFGSAITDAQYGPVAPNADIAVPISVNLTELGLTPALGLMVVTQDNKNGKDEASLVKIDVKP